ncbi:Tyrosine recombinase XerC [uncultured archaeon]|nr:Tyrosine recombinase XerC [uncultured archaeon]
MLKNFMRQIRAKNRTKRTIDTLEQSLVKAEKSIGKPLEDVTYEELLSYIESIKKHLSDNTVALYQSKFIQFYKFCFEETEDIKYNKLIKKLQNNTTGVKRNHINPSDILLPEDIRKLINVATIERDRCIVATLFESGMRRGELLSLTNNMVILNEQTQEVTFTIPDVEGCKTGGRTVVCLEICGYVQDWMKCNKSDRFMPVSENGLKRILINLFEKAGIKKPCNPHMFRHSSITNSVNIGMQQNAISMRFWGNINSDMLAHISHTPLSINTFFHNPYP